MVDFAEALQNLRRISPTNLCALCDCEIKNLSEKNLLHYMSGKQTIHRNINNSSDELISWQ